MNALSITTIMKIICLIFILVQVYILTSVIMSKQDDIAIMAKNTIDIAIGNSNAAYFNYAKITADLSKYGVMYKFHDYHLDPAYFIIAKILVAISCGLVSFLLLPEQIIIMLIVTVAGFFIPDILMRVLNESDNDEMQDDILTIYRMLKTHVDSGVYITDSLIECYRSISHPRLKQALNEMNNNILSKRVTVEEAVNQFNARFHNEQINDLAIIIKQAIYTGRSANLLEDIAKKININNKIRLQKHKEKLKRKIAFIQVLFYGAISLIFIYLILMEMVIGVSSI